MVCIFTAMVLDAAIQVEMDEEMTLRTLGDLDKQGTAESYFVSVSTPKAASLSGLNESFQNVAVAVAHSTSSTSGSNFTNTSTDTNSADPTSTGGDEGVGSQSEVKYGHSESAQNTGS